MILGYFFKHAWKTNPIDDWSGAVVCSNDEIDRVLHDMPEKARHEVAFKTCVPWDGRLVTVYMCKADNNGTVYLFADEDVYGFSSGHIETLR